MFIYFNMNSHNWNAHIKWIRDEDVFGILCLALNAREYFDEFSVSWWIVVVIAIIIVD